MNEKEIYERLAAPEVKSGYPASSIDREEVIDWICRVVSYWRWFLLSVVLFLSVAFFYVRLTTKVYRTTQTVLIRDDEASSRLLSLDRYVYPTLASNDIDSEIIRFSSPDLMLNVVRSLGLNVTYSKESRSRLRETDLHRRSPIKASMPDVAFDATPNIDIRITSRGDNRFDVAAWSDDEQDPFDEIVVSETCLPVTLVTPKGDVLLESTDNDCVYDRDILVRLIAPERVAEELLSSLAVGAYSMDNSRILEFALLSATPDKAADILDGLVVEYNRVNTIDDGESARNTALFIDERLRDLSVDLSSAEDQVEAFRKQNKMTSMDLPQSSDYAFTTEKEIEKERLELAISFDLLDYMDSYFADPANHNKLIPNLGLDLGNMSALIERYNQAIVARERVAKVSANDNPQLLQYAAQIEGMYKGLETALASTRRLLVLRGKSLDDQTSAIEELYRKAPSVERAFVELKRQQEVKASLYTFLLQKREEASLTQAAYASKAKVLLRPATGEVVSPNVTMIYLGALCLALGVVGVAIYLREVLNARVEGRRQLERLVPGCVVIGEISVAEIRPIAIEPEHFTPVAEMFRSLRNNLMMVMGQSMKVVTVSSVSPAEGKTFVALNIAYSFAIMNKKTLLIGLDLRNPKLAQELGIERSTEGISGYLARHTDDWRSLVCQTEASGGLHLIVAGVIPPNPNELLTSDRLDRLFAELRQEYDIIIVDSAPIGPVSDTQLIQRVTDAPLMVVKDGVTTKASLEFAERMVRDNLMSPSYYVLNGSKELDNRYAYRYKYGHRYAYNYSSINRQ